MAPGAVEIRTACSRDCPDACTVLATVHDGRVTRLAGERAHPITQGSLCFRTLRYLETHQAESGRLLEPLARRSWLEQRGVRPRSADPYRDRDRGEGAREGDDPLLPVSWEPLLDALAAQLREIRAESGPAAILLLRGGGSLGLLQHLYDRLFERFGPCSRTRGDVCSGAGDAANEADFGLGDAHDPTDLAHARQVVLWGKNPHASSPHLLPPLLAARRAGAGVTLIDPVAHRARELSDLYLQPRPGGDLALALAVGRLLLEAGAPDPEVPASLAGLEGFRALVRERPLADWLEEADVPEAHARRLAERLLERPAAILVGWGLQRRLSGAQTVRAIDALAALSGNLGISGGGASFSVRRKAPFALADIVEKTGIPRALCEPLLGHDILAASEPPVRAVWIAGQNPVVALPDSRTVARALETRELVVVCDTHLHDTARRAHVVLPVATMLEREDILGSYGHHYLQSQRRCVAPPPGVRTDVEIAQTMAERLGVGPALAGTARDWKRRLLAKVAPHGATLEAIEAGPVRDPLSSPVPFADGRFPTSDGRMHLLERLDPPPAPLLGEGEPEGYDLWLHTVSTHRGQCSQWAVDPAPWAARATVHPRTAAARGLHNGDAAALVSPLGRMEVTIHTDPAQREDVVIVPKGGSLDAGWCANALVPARTTDAGEGAAYLDARVRLEARRRERKQGW